MKQADWTRPSAIVLALSAGFGQSLALAAPATSADAIYPSGDIVTVNDFRRRSRPLQSRVAESSPSGIVTR